MRLIHEMIRMVLKLLFHIDTEKTTEDVLLNTEEKAILEELTAMVDKGEINEAENILYKMTADNSMQNLQLALLFYDHLNTKDDDFLREHGFSRAEIKLGVDNLVSDYGISGMGDVFVQ